MNSPVLEVRPEGLYCAAGDFYIDPWAPVPRAVITHGHSDHARTGMGKYYTTVAGLPILQWRLQHQAYQPYDYTETFTLGGARVSFHAAGHVLGSAQVRVEVNGETWVVSGDYKRQADPTCLPFDVVPCDVFITECTFGLPIYKWPDTGHVAREIVQWRDDCAQRGQTAVLFCYALGKAQRLLAELNACTNQPAYVHGALVPGIDIYRNTGIHMLDTVAVRDQSAAQDFAGQLVLAPPAAAGSPWMRRFRNAQFGFASGWMQVRGNRRRRNMDRGFVVSDHADWPALVQTVQQTGAKRVLVTHGDTRALVRFLNEAGTTATSLDTRYGEDD